MNEELGPLLIAPVSYLELRNRLRAALGFPNEWKALLIGIDGTNGSGKSALAAWLSWQLEMPAVHLDLYLVPNRDPPAWRTEDLARVIEVQKALERPMLIEGSQERLTFRRSAASFGVRRTTTGVPDFVNAGLG